VKTYNPTTALTSLSTIPISTASATQRAGRAGRTSPGVCYRLYPLSSFESLPRTTPAEITRVDMTLPILQLKSLGIDDLMKFEWVNAPPSESVLRALEGLVAAGMVGEDGRLTPLGEQVAEFPLEVGIARMVSLTALTPTAPKDLNCPDSFSNQRSSNAERRF
jgi:ATP-dependent RNA helicase DDX35